MWSLEAKLGLKDGVCKARTVSFTIHLCDVHGALHFAQV